MKINIVIDNPQNWFFEHLKEVMLKIKQLGHSCHFYKSHLRVPKNSDITFWFGCEKYITKKIRGRSKYNIVVHASDLPRGKGMSPTTWQILENKSKIPVTLFEVGDGFDDGDYYIKDGFKLDGGELIKDWQEKLYQCIERMILKFIKNIKNMKPTPQKGKASVYKRRTPEDSELDINKSIKSQFNLLRVVDNEKYPAFFYHKNHKYILRIYK